MGVFHFLKIVQMVLNRAKLQHPKIGYKMGILARTQLTFTCSKSATETCRSYVFIFSFEHILHLFLVFLLLTLSK